MNSATSEGLTLFVGHDEKPYNVFVITAGERRFFGVKRPVSYDPSQRKPDTLSCLVGFDDILGELLDVKTELTGYRFSYRQVLDETLTVSLIDQVDRIELTYPFKRLIDGAEWAQPASYWDARAQMPDTLDADEDFLREQSRRVIRENLSEGSTLFDPACSTGRFLEAVGRAIPNARLIGQDANPNMVALARARLDDAHVGDAGTPKCSDKLADLVICRFLNLDVLTTQQAETIFRRLAECVADDGWMLIIGHTPVLIDRTDMAACGFEVRCMVMLTPANHALYQFYLLRKGD